MQDITRNNGNRSIFAVVLAAGRSQRFGRNKLLEAMDGEPLVRRAARLGRAIAGDRTVLVTGYDGAATRAAAGDAAQFLIVNDRHDQGMGVSIALGTNAVAHVADALLLLFADQPLVTAQHLEALVDGWSGADDQIVATAYAGTQGPPVLFPRGAFRALGELTGDAGAKCVLRNPAFDVRTVTFEDAAIDIDTPADLHDCIARRPPAR